MTILGVDIWEGNPVIDEQLLTAEGVRFFIIRLNDMSGGHHMDQNFPAQWEQAAPYIRWPYFVYNPWVSGDANYNWLAEHIPPDARAVSIDIEVRKPDYPPAEYYRQTEIFRSLVAQSYNYNYYTGAWFLACMSQWPAVDYWWARYPYALYPPSRQSLTWSELRAKIDTFGWYPGSGIPGPCKLWQCTADRYILPGCGGTCVDINQWNGTLEELQLWAGYVQPPLTLEQRFEQLEQRVTRIENEARARGWSV